jgi:hypothetical protein
MAAAGLSLEPERWYAWDIISVRAFGNSWPSTPIFITAVTPLKSGKNILRISFVAALRPISQGGLTVDLRIVHHRPNHLVGTFFDAEQSEHTASVSIPTMEWFQYRCHDFATRFPPANFQWQEFVLVDETGAAVHPVKEVGIEDYLPRAFGTDEERILVGATENSFGSKKYALPKARATLPFDYTFSGLESFLIMRGFVPRVMEEKWFIYVKDNHLIFRRSWSGVCIYCAAIERRGDELHTSHALVNRNPKQYTETDDRYDLEILRFLFSTILLGRPQPFPKKETLSGEDQVMQAWSNAGSAILKS